MTTDTNEKELERLICTALAGSACDPPQAGGIHERPSTYGVGWICGDPEEYDRDHCVDLAQLSAFLHATQPEVAESLDLGEDSPTRRKFLARLQGEVTRHGTIEVLRKGIKHGPHQIDLFYGTPSPGNMKAKALYGQNRFSVTRQLRYSRDQAQLALDLCLFINGLPIATFELKNSLTKQTVEDAVEQYKRDRHPGERLFELGRCLDHFAVDDHEVRFCTHLQGKESWFLPFNRGGRTAPATRRTPTASRPTTCGSRSSPATGSPTSLRTTPRWWRRGTRRRDAGSTSRSGPGSTSWTWCGVCWPTPPAGAPAPSISSSTRRAAASPTPSPGSPTS